MKGVILNCLAEMVQKRFSEERWQDILEQAGLDRKSVFFTTQDVDDGSTLRILECTCRLLNMSLAQAADAFGDYWVNVFAPRIYWAYYQGTNSARDFLLRMDAVHEATTRSMPGAHPPRFRCEWKDDRTLIMKYESQRGLIDLMVGLIKGIGKHYKEDLQVRKMGPDRVEVVFPK